MALILEIILPSIYLVLLTYSRAIMLILYKSHYGADRRDILMSILINVEPEARQAIY